jgi:hypothetical protein
MKGYLDRIEDNQLAVILVEEVNKEFVLPISELPEGSKPKIWFDLVINQGRITSININNKKTETAQEKVDDTLCKIRSKSKGSKFK